MKIVRMLHPFCIPIFGYIAGGEEIGMPDNIANAMVAAGYAGFVDWVVPTVTGGGIPPIVSGGLPPIVSSGVAMYVPLVAIEPPTEPSVEESRKGKRKNWSAAEDTLIEES